MKRAKPRPAPNTTCDVYRWNRSPPAAPNSSIAIRLTAVYARGLNLDEGDGTDRKHTHVAVAALEADVRDAYDAGTIGSTADVLYVPDSDGTAFTVVFVEFVHLGGPAAFKRIYLARRGPGWPTEEL